jgi:hypothetical protein
MINRTRSGHVLLSAGIGALLLLHATSPAHAQGGAALAGPAGTQFEVQVLIGSQEFDEDFAAAAGAEVRTAMAEVSVATAVARAPLEAAACWRTSTPIPRSAPRLRARFAGRTSSRLREPTHTASSSSWWGT